MMVHDERAALKHSAKNGMVSEPRRKGRGSARPQHERWSQMAEFLLDSPACRNLTGSTPVQQQPRNGTRRVGRTPGSPGRAKHGGIESRAQRSATLLLSPVHVEREEVALLSPGSRLVTV